MERQRRRGRRRRRKDAEDCWSQVPWPPWHHWIQYTLLVATRNSIKSRLMELSNLRKSELNLFETFSDYKIRFCYAAAFSNRRQQLYIPKMADALLTVLRCCRGNCPTQWLDAFLCSPHLYCTSLQQPWLALLQLRTRSDQQEFNKTLKKKKKKKCVTHAGNRPGQGHIPNIHTQSYTSLCECIRPNDTLWLDPSWGHRKLQTNVHRYSWGKIGGYCRSTASDLVTYV